MKVVVLVQNGHVTQVLKSHPSIGVEVISVDTHCRQCEIQARELVIQRQADKTYPHIGFTTPTGYCEHCRDCGQPTGEGGDGYDGRCGNCADKAEEKAECSDCDQPVSRDDPYYATPCGSYCSDCMISHMKECGVCRDEFTEDISEEEDRAERESIGDYPISGPVRPDGAA